MEKKMTIHEALSTIKVLDKRISDTSRKQFITANRKNNEKIDGIEISKKKEEFKANLQSLKDLISNRAVLKNAIAMSNAVTKITVAGKEYTIVEAIEEKHFAERRQVILRELRNQYKLAVNNANLANQSLPDNCDRYLASLGATEKNGRSSDEIKKLRDEYMNQNTWELIDPNDLSKVIEDMDKELTDFVSNIDFKLSESNAVTLITVDLAAE